MIVLSHRGYWKKPDEKNTVTAFKHSFRFGFGTETDIRDCKNNIVISHDAPDGSELLLRDFLHISEGFNVMLGLNIKSDGLAENLNKMMHNFPELNYFTFDMSIPDMRAYLDIGLPVFCRVSEVEPHPPWLDECKGVWLDSFFEDWFDASDVKKFLNMGKAVCVVSPELHNRPYINMWKKLSMIKDNKKLYICTDFPEEAELFFKGNH